MKIYVPISTLKAAALINEEKRKSGVAIYGVYVEAAPESSITRTAARTNSVIGVFTDDIAALDLTYRPCLPKGEGNVVTEADIEYQTKCFPVDWHVHITRKPPPPQRLPTHGRCIIPTEFIRSLKVTKKQMRSDIAEISITPDASSADTSTPSRICSIKLPGKDPIPFDEIRHHYDDYTSSVPSGPYNSSVPFPPFYGSYFDRLYKAIKTWWHSPSSGYTPSIRLIPTARQGNYYPIRVEVPVLDNARRFVGAFDGNQDLVPQQTLPDIYAILGIPPVTSQ